jgi:hypothetical protein
MVQAQSGSASTDQMLTLDNYLIPVGCQGCQKLPKIIVPESCNCDAEVASVKVYGRIFTIDSKGGISLKKSVTLKTDSGPFVYGITIKAGCLQKSLNLLRISL